MLFLYNNWYTVVKRPLPVRSILIYCLVDYKQYVNDFTTNLNIYQK